MPYELEPYLRRLQKLGLNEAAQAFQDLKLKLQSGGTLPPALPVLSRGAQRLQTINELGAKLAALGDLNNVSDPKIAKKADSLAHRLAYQTSRALTAEGFNYAAWTALHHYKYQSETDPDERAFLVERLQHGNIDPNSTPSLEGYQQTLPPHLRPVLPLFIASHLYSELLKVPEDLLPKST